MGNPETKLSKLFSVMEGMKAEFPEIENYQVSETTLEQVFLSFAKQQIAEDDADKKASIAVSASDGTANDGYGTFGEESQKSSVNCETDDASENR